ncbi:MAG: YlbF family regulator, partial [Candidatus Flemingiibacterium sp.]
KKETQDTELIGLIEKRIHELYHEIMENENMVAFTKAQDVVNAFMAEVNGEITYQITGERPCTHDCSTCGGCHH